MPGKIDDNFEDFVSNWDLFRGRLTIFLGAGASIGAKNKLGEDLPNAYALRNTLWQRFKHDGSTAFDPESLKLMSLEHAAAIIETKTGRTPMSEFLVEHFTCFLPLWQHVALANLGARSIFTTNYDELVELGYKSSSSLPPDIIYDDRQALSGRMPLYKPHGSLTYAHEPVGKGGLVITQFDYFEMISSYRKMISKAMGGFENSCVLLIGYSFSDMDIGAELYSIRQKNRGIPWYTVFPRDDHQVRKMYSNRLFINQINMDFEQFMTKLDNRVNFLPPELKNSRIKKLRAAGRIQ
ncbi:hypothetical protein MesoLj113a_71720 [Mesorhizobium sp. 113-1-2]|uniref:SIR2 family protein n=1 Tax=unclassified Mesorhizobium TaxID=325217 RepID=UPI0002BF2F03|nr:MULTISPECIES: SIR2 family protein [unclassified Mesorhizobium]BCG76014.1 hypothetical protein MesoLj113a_71720 [Mesorhizobium sp. 113-1-2]CCV11475.1 hypothetical protein MESS4_330024 [Mesorhizobium sp. STM 4661]